jgi:hypothetical protein
VEIEISVSIETRLNLHDKKGSGNDKSLHIARAALYNTKLVYN